MVYACSSRIVTNIVSVKTFSHGICYLKVASAIRRIVIRLGSSPSLCRAHVDSDIFAVVYMELKAIKFTAVNMAIDKNKIQVKISSI